MTLQDARPVAASQFRVTLQHAGSALGKPGELTVDDDSLVFRGRGGLARLGGVRTLKRSRTAIERVELLGTEGPVVVHFDGSDGASWTLGCSDATDLLQLLAPEPVTAAPVLVEGAASVALGNGPVQPGRIRLTSERLSFQAEGSEEAELDVEWSALTASQVRGFRPQLYCSVAGEAIRVEGELVPALAAQLTALRHSEPSAPGEAGMDPALVRWPACRRHGAIAIQGELVVGRQHLEFVPNGVMERTLGLQGVAIPFKQVLRAVVHGWGSRKLTLVTAQARETFTMEDVEGRFEQLFELYNEGYTGFMADPRRQRRAVCKVLDRWADAIPVDRSRIIEAQPVLQRVDKHDFSVGVLVQTADVIRYYPAGGPSGPSCAESHPVPRILRRYGGLAPTSPTIAFEEGGRSYAYVPSAGIEFTRRFWDRCRAPSRIVHLDVPARRTVERVLGPARFRRVRTSEGAVVNLQQMYQEGMAWIGTFSPAGPLPELGQQVSVDVGQPDGVYRFETQVLDVSVDGDEARLFLTRPKIIRIYNQRRTYRVPVDISARAHLRGQSAQLAPLLAEDSLAGPELQRLGAVAGLDLQLSDLSLGGCAAEGEADLPVGATVELELDVGRRPLRVRGRVLRSDEAGDSALRRFGIRFEDLRQATERELQRHVLAAQRMELSTPSGALAAR